MLKQDQPVNITAGANIQSIGALVGQNSGTISNVAVLSGSVNGGSFTGIGAGGLAGQNNAGGSISNSSANVYVAVGNSPNQAQLNYAGGLLANNFGSVTNSSASGNVNGGTGAVTLEFQFWPVFSSSDKDKQSVAWWLLELTTNLWRSAAKPNSAWTSGRQRFRDFAFGRLRNRVDA